MKIGIVGTGKLGLCMALCLDNSKFEVYCYDINKQLLNDIKNKTLQTNEKNVNELLIKSNLKFADNEEDIVAICDVIFVFIQTPSLSSGEYDHSYINTFIDMCVNVDCHNKILVISSTVMPEYTDSIIKRFDSRNNTHICYNPTFIAQGSIIENLINPEMILIGGHSKDAMNTVESIHKHIIKNNATIHHITPIEAEISKICINCFITTKIAYANMVGDLAVSKNIEPSNILNAIGSDSRIGNKYLGYGYGFGGPCFPRDNKAIYHYAKNNGFNFRLCETTDTMNNDHLQNQFQSIINKKINNYEFTYITYKDTSDILEESQKLKLALMLVDAGIKVTIQERFHVIEKLKSLYGNNKFEYYTIS